MSTLYIANATQQYHEFWYRLPGQSAIRQMIDPGNQIRIAAKGGNLTPEDIEAVVKFDEVYGLIPVSEIGKRPGALCPRCYSIDKPVPFAKVYELSKHNEQVMIQRGIKTRADAAVAIDQRFRAQLEMAAQESNRQVGQLQQLSVEVEEITPARVVGERRQENEGLEQALADVQFTRPDGKTSSKPDMGFKVLRTTDAPPPGMKARRRRRV